MSGAVNMRWVIHLYKVAIIVVLLMIAEPFSAQAACSLTSTSILFGSYDIFSSTPLDTLGQIIFRCSNNDHNISISLDKGGAPTFDPRRLLNGASTLSYNLYLDAARTTIWGDGTGGTQSFFVQNPTNNRDISIPLYGRIPAGQSTSAGNYSNTLTVTINF
jgi:spore coat protein U domain-containing protein, fimbrial subunit CupE1/2/3/6